MTIGNLIGVLRNDTERIHFPIWTGTQNPSCQTPLRVVLRKINYVRLLKDLFPNSPDSLG